MTTAYAVCKNGATVCTCPTLADADRWISSRPPHLRERYTIKGLRRPA